MTTKKTLKSKTEDDLSEDNDDPRFAAIHTGRRVPVYRKFGEFQTKRLREIFYNILQNIDESSIIETLPGELCKRQKLISRADALKQIHFPPENSNLLEYESFRSAAHLRLIFEEFFLGFIFASTQTRRTQKRTERNDNRNFRHDSQANE